jgi:hypothetical protein
MELSVVMNQLKNQVSTKGKITLKDQNSKVGLKNMKVL